MRLAILALSLTFAALPVAYAQGEPANLSGVWRRDPQKSPPTEHPPEEMVVKIDQNGAEIVITLRVRNGGALETNIQHLRIGAGQNANEIHGAPMNSKAAWDGAALVVDSIAKFRDGELRLNDRWTISPDRQTLTFVERHQFGAEPAPGENTTVFDRQPDASWTAAPSITMGVVSRSLGVDCAHCHVEGAMDRSDKPAFAQARRMFQMRDWIAQHAKIETSCWTCHRGHSVPEAGPQIDAANWPAELNLNTQQAAEPASMVYRNLKFFNATAGDLKSSMLFMSASLGVGCANCHVVGEWEKDDKPVKNIARSMLALVRDTRAEFTGIRVGCFTCHHGAARPEIAPPAGK